MFNISRQSALNSGLLFLIFIVFSCFSAQAEIYIWEDSQGVLHFSNVSHPDEIKGIKKFSENSTKPLALRKNQNQETLFQVEKIYDGDSIKVKGHSLSLMIRLVGIDAPETGGRKRTGQPYSRQSGKLLEKLVSGKKVHIKSYGTDNYNRQLAEVFVNNRNINLEMVKAGMAEVYKGKHPAALEISAYKRAESSAKRSYKGIWRQGSRYKSPRQWRREHPRK